MNKSKLRKIILFNSNSIKKNNPNDQVNNNNISPNPPNPLHQKSFELTSKISPPSLSNQLTSRYLKENQNNTFNISSSSQLFEESCKEFFSSRNQSFSKAFVFNSTRHSFYNNVGQVMQHYRYQSYEKDEHKGDVSKLFPKVSRNKYIKNREEIKNILRKTRQLQKSQSVSNIREENNANKIKFDIIQEHFKNPMQSYYLIQKNKLIYQSMIQNFKNFEKDVFRTTFDRLNPLLKRTLEIEKTKGYKSQPKIKIANKIPKIVDTSWFNAPNIAQINNNHEQQKQAHRKDSIQSVSKLSDVVIGKTNNIPSIELKVNFINSTTEFPESREQFVFAQLGSDCLLCGGLVSNKNTNIVWEYNPDSLNWTKHYITSGFPEARYGHTGVIHNNKLIIFGGKYLTLSLFGDIEVYNMDNKTWYTPSISTYTKLKLRRNHIACLVGNQMFIHGGVDEEGNFLDDCYLLNLNPLKWVNCQLNEDSISPTLAYHKCCLVLPEEIRINPKLSIYRYPEMGIKHLANYNIKEKGIYVFGGKHSANGKAISDLYILRIGRRPLEWGKVKTQGIGPSSRYLSSLNYYEEGNCLVIHGGRNDGMLHDFALNDTYILELFTLNWIRVEYCYEGGLMRVNNRCAHETLIYHHKLIIFGGMNSDSYLGGHLCVIDLASANKEESEEEDSEKRSFSLKPNKKRKNK